MDEFTRQNDAPRGEAGQVAAVSYTENHDVTVVLQFGARTARTVSAYYVTLYSSPPARRRLQWMVLSLPVCCRDM